MKYKILRTDGDYDFHNNSTITELPEGAIALTDEEWENRLQPSESQLLASAKTSKLAQCKSACEAFRTSPLTVEGATYKTTDNAKLKFWSLVNGSLTGDYPIIWLESDDVSFVSLTKIQATAIYDAFEAQDRSAYQQRGAYLSQIENCSTIEELNNININFI